MEKRNWNLIIPSIILFDNKLSSGEKIILSLIHSLSKESGYCHAKNTYFASVLNVNNVRVSGIITTLIKKSYIERKIIRNDRKQIISRELRLLIDIPIIKNNNRANVINDNYPDIKNDKGNNILINKIKISI